MQWTCVCIPNLAPVAVILDAVNRQGNHLHTSFLKLVADPSGAGELSGADGGEVPRVGEQDAPSIEQNTHKATRSLFYTSELCTHVFLFKDWPCIELTVYGLAMLHSSRAACAEWRTKGQTCTKACNAHWIANLRFVHLFCFMCFLHTCLYAQMCPIDEEEAKKPNCK